MNRIYCIGNAHIDPVWLWRWPEGLAEIKATFKSALDRMDEYPDFVFTSACASYYRWVEENEPAMFERIRERVAQGRWEITGGWWLQPDCNIPSGESFARHALYSQRYFLEKFNKTATVGYNVDSFGHNGMLPQILKKSGMDSYVFMRPDRNEKDIGSCAFIWESPDGSRVKTFRIINGYNNDLNEERILDRLDAVKNESGRDNVPVMFFYGVGNHGGGPTRAVVELLKKLESSGRFNLSMARTDKYFNELEGSSARLPVLKGDLQHHASGCYSTTSEVKRLNRKAENRLTTAETAAFMANRLFGLNYDRKSLQKAWEDVLFNQFHDIMGGCSIRPAYDNASEFHGEALKIAGDIQNASIQKISWNVNTAIPGAPDSPDSLDKTLEDMKKAPLPLFVFNPNAKPLKAPVRCKLSERVEGPDGSPVQTQTIRSHKTDKHRKWDTMFIADLPPLGYKVYRIYREAGDKAENTLKGTLAYGDDFIESSSYKITFDRSTGWISSLMEKSIGNELFKAPAAVPVVMDDSGSDTWAHGITTFDKEIGRFADASLKVTEKGPLRVTMRVVSRFGSSLISQDFSLYEDIDGVFVSVKADWREERKILKLSFPVAIDNPSAAYEIPYGFIRKDANGEEEAGHSWFAAEGTGPGGGTQGLYITNDSKYSYDVKGCDMRLTALRSAYYADHFGEHDEFNEAMDLGIDRFSYSMHPFKGPLEKNHPSATASALNNPPLAIPETYHEGPLPLEKSFLEIEEDNIDVHALKMGEDGDEAVIRCVETAGVQTEAHIDFKLTGQKWNAVFSPYEIKTFVAGDAVYETNLTELERGDEIG